MSELKIFRPYPNYAGELHLNYMASLFISGRKSSNYLDKRRAFIIFLCGQ